MEVAVISQHSVPSLLTLINVVVRNLESLGGGFAVLNVLVHKWRFPFGLLTH